MRAVGTRAGKARRAVVGLAVIAATVLVSAGPAAADCDLADVGRSGTAPSGTSVLVDGLYYTCIGSSWVG